uniref:PWWP domain-containing protein n=1 Tax=Schistocephalus solidus TaxID=70667 RepID=A0A183SJQ1_SCHSO
LKWRFLEGVKDPTELNEAWHCALQSKYAYKEDLGVACEEPETIGNLDKTQYVYGEFATGSVVLAKMPGQSLGCVAFLNKNEIKCYPEWPSMIDCDAEGRFAEFCPKTGEVKSYRVVFLDPENRTTQLIPASRIRRFSNASMIRLEKRYGKYKRKLEAAIEEATKALELPVEVHNYSSTRMNLETCIESCLQSVKNMSAARLYNNYVVPYRVRRRAKTTEDLTKEVFQAKKLINQNIVHLFSLALKNLIGVGGKASSVGIEGTWIECTRCKKWRFEPEVRDPSEIAENWRCCLQKKLAHLQPSVEVEEAACAEPEDATAKFHDQSYLFNEFTAGSIVLAKMPGFPWWPAMVDLDASGKYARFDPETHIATHYNVVFLDPCKSTTKLLPASSLCKFTQADKADILRKVGSYA